MTIKFLVEIRASNRSWFPAVNADGVEEAPMSAEDADRMIAKFREQGFEARSRFAD